MGVKIPVTDLLKSLQKTGLPFGNAQAMNEAAPGAGDAIRARITSEDTVSPEILKNFHSQLAQVAEMDRKLGSVYSDPTSQLYTDNVLAREKILSGAHRTNSSAVGYQSKVYKEKQRQLEEQAREEEQEYKLLTAVQAKEEARAAQLAKDEERIKQGKAKYITDSEGNKVLVPVYKGKSGSGGAGTNKKLVQSGLSDPSAVDTFLNAPAKFQDQWIRDYQRGLYKGKLTKDVVLKAIKNWDSVYNPSKKSSSSSGRTSEENAKLILEAFSKK